MQLLGRYNIRPKTQASAILIIVFNKTLGSKVLNRLWIKSFIVLVLLSVQPAKADYSFDTPLSSPADSTDSTFSIDSNDTSCSSGGGSTPSLWVGASNGNGRTSANDYNGGRKDDSFFTGTIGINIPLGAKHSNNECKKLLALVEAKELLNVIESLKSLGLLNEEKARTKIKESFARLSRSANVDLSPLIEIKNEDF